MSALQWPLCQFFETPPPGHWASRIDPDGVIGCERRQGEGPLYFFVPVEGGAVRVGVCPEHAGYLERLYGKPS
jgi:hypothetical protein